MLKKLIALFIFSLVVFGSLAKAQECAPPPIGEVSIYNLETGDRQAGFVISGGAAFVRFNLEGDKLFILSATQTAYAFNLNKIANLAPQKSE